MSETAEIRHIGHNSVVAKNELQAIVERIENVEAEITDQVLGPSVLRERAEVTEGFDLDGDVVGGSSDEQPQERQALRLV